MKRDLVKKNGFISLLCAGLFGLAIAYLTATGLSARTYSREFQARVIAEPSRACVLWEESGVKGRILFLFDRSLNADPSAASTLPDERLTVTSDNYVYVAFRKNLVRRVYHILPDASWGDVERNLKGNPYVQDTGGVFRLTIEGMPVLIMRLRDIPATKEPVLINMNEAAWGDAGMEVLAGLLKQRVLTGDIITIAGNPARERMGEIRSYE